MEKRASLDKYLSHLDDIFQIEPAFYSNASLIEGVHGVSSIIYRDIPEKGMITGITFGLSLVKHEDWKLGRPELMISVNSDDISWGQVVGFLANRLRGDCPFSYGNTINFREKISSASEMDAFLIFAPSILDQEDFLNIDVDMDYKINLAGVYPIYASEMEVIDKVGLKAFWHHPKFDLYDVKRERITTKDF